MSGAVLAVPTAPFGVRAVFSTRNGGVSTGPYAALNIGGAVGDDPVAVRANRMTLAREAGFDPGTAVLLRQVHGARVLRAGSDDAAGRFVGDLAGIADADAAVTADAGVALVVQAADCVPVLAWTCAGGRVAAAHAGWRGLVAGVVEGTIRALDAGGGVGAAIGPCVGACCYPVDEGLRGEMAAAFGDQVVVGAAVDLRAAARAALVHAGVPDEAITDVGGCTSCEADTFFSYRRDGARTGRQAGIIWRTEAT